MQQAKVATVPIFEVFACQSTCQDHLERFGLTLRGNQDVDSRLLGDKLRFGKQTRKEVGRAQIWRAFGRNDSHPGR